MNAPLDHGTLNVPLAKRGNIDAQLDRYKADQARAAKATRKAKAAEQADLRVAAKALLAAITPERLAHLADHCKTTVPAVRKHLKSEAHWNPELVIKLLAADRAERMPDILPDTTDDVLWERAVAHDLAHHAGKRTGHQNEVVRRQGDYARRLDAIATQRGQQ